MANVIEILHGERAKAVARVAALDSAIKVLAEPRDGGAIVRVSPGNVPAKRETGGAKKGVKRGPDSELTKARKRIASAKRFGREPLQADLDLVAVNEGATSAVAAE